MIRTSIAFGVLLLVACYSGVGASPCPIPNHPGAVHSGQIITALNSGSIPIYEGADTQCYNYTLPYNFQSPPEVAIAVHDFESEPSNNLFFFIKPVRSESLSIIAFVVRTQWTYTRWSQISFTFLAEDRQDLESGYYQVDSGSLSGCDNGKQIEVLLPFRNTYQFGPAPFNKDIKYELFLHGFEITTLPINSTHRSPFEISIASSFVNRTGISVAISVTTITQVNSIFISYFAYQMTSLSILQDFYNFEANLTTSLIYSPNVAIPRSYARIYGLSGFIFVHSQGKIAYRTRWDGFSFYFEYTQQSSIKYLSFRYIFFTGSDCEDCLGYPISYNNTCINYCPQGTYRTLENTCIYCGIGKIWNGTQCIIDCSNGQFYNNLTKLCECPQTFHWNGESCIICNSGKVFVPETLSCDCVYPLRWNGVTCAQIPACTNGKVYDIFIYSCKCPDTSFWNGTYCKEIVPCTGGRVHDMNYNCVCQDTRFYWDGRNCVFSPCIGGQIWQGTSCVCPINTNFNGSMCLECINGQTWNKDQKKCACEDGYEWNGQYCQRSKVCTLNRYWNETYQQCICRDSYYWGGYACLPIETCIGRQYWNSVLQKCVCPTGYKWDGKQCLLCQNGEIWDPTTLKCVCPPGTIAINKVCTIQQACSGGKMFMQNTLTCECPENTNWNGNYCISNPCSNGREWSQKQKSCICPNNKVWINERCVPPQISCNNGRIWNPKIYACECPMGTYPNLNMCQTTPICINGMTYNPLTNKCACPFGLVMKQNKCQAPNCPTGQYWNGYQCSIISCPAPSYFVENRCVYGGQSSCTYGYYWNGQTCVLYRNTCPLGTNWKGFTCQTSGVCSNGYFLGSNGQCEAFPQQCTPPTSWSGNSCSTSGGCPKQTYFSNGKCYPVVNCQNGHIWDSTYLRCICPAGQVSNGQLCIKCPNGKIWENSKGCMCPKGSFDTGSSCEELSQDKCSRIKNAIWENNLCACLPRFTKIGFQCVCYGTQVGQLCDKCSYKPHSDWDQVSNICKCQNGYTEIRGNCIPNSISTGNDNPSQCNVGSYFDPNHKMCIACPDGCLSCFDCYRCRLCRSEFLYDALTEQCYEKCGDGKRFVHECDDGNNKDGDGCSRDCKTQIGYQCTGGSPDQSDKCVLFRPDKVTIEMVGQVRKSSSIVINVKLNYLPNSLLFSGDCANNCNSILKTSLVSGDQAAISITSTFVIGTKYIFAVAIEFGKPYIGNFKLSVGINQSLVPRYFGAIPTETAVIDVKPAYLSVVSEEQNLQ